MMGGYDSPDIKYVTIDGERYRTGSKLRDRVGPAITYNSGTMLSGAADLFRVTSDATYQTDLEELTDNSFAYFPNLKLPNRAVIHLMSADSATGSTVY